MTRFALNDGDLRNTLDLPHQTERSQSEEFPRFPARMASSLKESGSRKCNCRQRFLWRQLLWPT